LRILSFFLPPHPESTGASNLTGSLPPREPITARIIPEIIACPSAAWHSSWTA
jgi:hypothetical protein